MGDVVEHPDDDDQASALTVPQESQEEDADDDPADMRDEDDPHNPREPRRPMEPGKILLQGFRTVSQTLSEAYGNACGEIEILLQKSLAKATNEDRNFVFGASRSICDWVDCVKLAMALLEQSAEEQT